MEILGNGLIAQCLSESVGGRHPHVTAIAAGVSRTSVASVAEFDREASLVFETLRRCRERGRLVLFFSTASTHMYGPGSPGTETGQVFPMSAYGRHKLGLEAVFQASDANWLALRLSHVVGSMQKAHQLIPSMVQQVRSGTVTLHQNAYRDVIDACHVACSVDRLLADGVQNLVVNIASGRPEPIARIVAGIESRLGVVAHKTIAAMPATNTVVSVERLMRLVPEAKDFGFGSEYLDRVLDRYVGPARVRDLRLTPAVASSS